MVIGLITPNERQRIIHAERERRRIARLQQVRQLSRQAAAAQRVEVTTRKREEVHQIKKQIVLELRKHTPSLSRSITRRRQALLAKSQNARTTPARNGHTSHNNTPKTRSASIKVKAVMTSAACQEATRRGQQALERLRAEKSVQRRREAERRAQVERAKETANTRSQAGAR